jgi:hypothetical protein
VAAVAIGVFAQIERDNVVSRISGSTPYQINLFHGEFVRNVFVYTLPLLGALVATSTDMADLIHSWVDPLLQALR